MCRALTVKGYLASVRFCFYTSPSFPSSGFSCYSVLLTNSFLFLAHSCRHRSLRPDRLHRVPAFFEIWQRTRCALPGIVAKQFRSCCIWFRRCVPVLTLWLGAVGKRTTSQATVEAGLASALYYFASLLFFLTRFSLNWFSLTFSFWVFLQILLATSNTTSSDHSTGACRGPGHGVPAGFRVFGSPCPPSRRRQYRSKTKSESVWLSLLFINFNFNFLLV